MQSSRTSSPGATLGRAGAGILPSYKWWAVFMLGFLCFFNYADRQVIFAVLIPKLKEEFSLDKVQLGLIGSAFMWVYAFGAPAAGLMNTVGWSGSALGPVYVGFASKYGGKPTEIENMSDAIAFGGVIFLVAAALIGEAMLLFAHQRKLAPAQ